MPSHFLILLAAAVVRLDDDEGFNGDAFAAAVFFALMVLSSRAMMAKSLYFFPVCDQEFEINSFRGLSLSHIRDYQ